MKNKQIGMGNLNFRISGAADDALVDIQAGHEDSESKLHSFSMIAYTGGPMLLSGWYYPVVVDLKGMSFSSKARPILRDHDTRQIVGHSTKISKTNGILRVEGQISAGNAHANEVIESGLNGFPWQASLGARGTKMLFVKEGKTATANGREFAGPIYIARRSILGEVSFVALGADDNTESTVNQMAASANVFMEIGVSKMDEFKKWLEAQGFDFEDLTEKQGESLKAQFDAEIAAKAEVNEDEEIVTDTPVVDTDAIVASVEKTVIETHARLAKISDLCDGHPDIAAAAIKEKWSEDKVELEVLKAGRPSGFNINSSVEHSSDAVLEAAVCLSGGINVEKSFDEKTLEAADKTYKRQLGLQELMIIAANRNGHNFTSFSRNHKEIMQAAFSTLSLPEIFSNVANKSLLAGYMSVEDTWRKIAAIKPVKDFKQISSYRLNGGFKYDEVAPDGELTHASVGEEKFTNQASTFGKMFSVTRADIINDDLGALTVVPSRLGRGGALAFNELFWTKWLNDVAFFTAGNNNLLTGPSSVLDIDGLTLVDERFLDLKDTDGFPMALTPRILLVPNALKTTAKQLMNDTEVRPGSGTTKKLLVGNPHAGSYEVVTSSYLGDTSIPGNSKTAHYLLADPRDMAAIEVVFLNGVQTPTVQSAEADFATLGVQFRGFHDFGMALQEPKSAVKSEGA